ncbi:MAG: heparinase II/III family protein [Rhizobiaceae bacterium]
MRAPNFILIPSLIAGELWRRASRRIRKGPLYRWRYSGAGVDQLTIAPTELRPADITLATQFYMGQFTFANETISTAGEPPFTIPAPSDEWFAELHSFKWLRHLRAANSDLMQAHASALVSDWISQWGSQIESQSWRPDIINGRLISWLTHSPLLINNTSPESYQEFLKSLARQTRYLNHISPSVRDGYPRLHTRIALAFAALCLDGKEKAIKQATHDLNSELNRQILADGGHVSRNPVILVELLADLIPLRQAYQELGHSPSHTLLSAIDRMLAVLRFFQHSNGELAQFNGTGSTPAKMLSTILSFDESKGSPQRSAPQSGYERLAENNTVVLIDTGKALSRGTARRAMAGTLSFELSSGSTRFIANCGVPSSAYKIYAPYARATAAHSTATIGNKSSSRFATDSKFHSLLPSPLIRGPNQISLSRDQTQEYETLTASHDGYLQEFGIIHTRNLHLSNNGEVLNGSDEFTRQPAPQSTLPPSVPIELRFHLPPAISASMLTSGHSILIATQDNDAWTFTCVDGPISLEESIQFSGPDLPRKSQQIVVSINAQTKTEVRWTLERRIKKPAKRPRATSNTPNSTPDLLDGLENNGAT